MSLEELAPELARLEFGEADGLWHAKGGHVYVECNCWQRCEADFSPAAGLPQL
jgi:hypothetical protein